MRLEIGLVASRSESNRKRKAAEQLRYHRHTKARYREIKMLNVVSYLVSSRRQEGGFELRNDLHPTK